MAIKQVQRRICDFCDKDASGEPCDFCHQDFCYSHGERYRAMDQEHSRPIFSFCDACARDLFAKLRAGSKAGEHA